MRVRSSTDGRRRNGNETAGPSPTCGVTTLTRTGHKTNPNPTDRPDPRWFPTRIRRKSSGSSPAETPSHLLHDSFPFSLTTSWFLSLSLFRRAVCESDSDARGEIKNNNNSMSKKKKKLQCTHAVFSSFLGGKPAKALWRSRHAKTTSQPRATLSMAACMPLASLLSRPCFFFFFLIFSPPLASRRRRYEYDGVSG